MYPGYCLIDLSPIHDKCPDLVMPGSGGFGISTVAIDIPSDDEKSICLCDKVMTGVRSSHNSYAIPENSKTVQIQPHRY